MVDHWDHYLELLVIGEAIEQLGILGHLRRLVLERVSLLAALHEARKDVPL